MCNQFNIIFLSFKIIRTCDLIQLNWIKFLAPERGPPPAPPLLPGAPGAPPPPPFLAPNGGPNQTGRDPSPGEYF